MHPALEAMLKDWLPLPANAITRFSLLQMSMYYSQDEQQLKAVLTQNLGSALGRFIVQEGRGELLRRDDPVTKEVEFRLEAYVLTKAEIAALMSAAFEAGRRLLPVESRDAQAKNVRPEFLLDGQEPLYH